jgi:enoyl-CoA hydratase
MAYQNIQLEVRDRIAFLTLNRPQVLNALNDELIDELRLVFDELRKDPAVGGIILTGSGEKAFCAGADIEELRRNNAIQGVATALRGQAVFRGIETCGKPVIAAVNGVALGGGCELAMSCTLRIAAEKARFGQPEVNLGLIPGYGGTQRLPRLVGRGVALEMIMTGRFVGAEEAFRVGLANKVVPQVELLKSAEEMMRLILGKAPIAVRLGMEAVHRGMDLDRENALNLEAQLFGLCFSTADGKEGLTAFLEKRPAVFRNE